MYRLSSRCRGHTDKAQKTGDASGVNLLMRELKPHLRPAAAFMKAQEHHPGIAAALQRIAEWLEEANRLAPAYLQRSSSGAHRTQVWLGQLHRDGIDPRQIVGMLIAVHLYRLHDPRRFPSDAFFRHQCALRVLRLTPGRYRGNASRGKGRVCRDRITAHTAEHLGRLLCSGQMGVLCERAAGHIFEQPLREQQRREIAGIHEPF